MIGARREGGKSRHSLGGSMNKKIPCSFHYVANLLSTGEGGIFSKWWVFLRMGWGTFLVLSPTHDTFFGENPNCCHIFYCTDIDIFPDRGGFNFLRELFDSLKNLPPPPLLQHPLKSITPKHSKK